MKKNNIVTLVSEISVFLNTEIGCYTNDLFAWYVNKGEIHLNIKKNEISLIDDPELDLKTYYAIYGISKTYDMNFKEYYTEK